MTATNNVIIIKFLCITGPSDATSLALMYGNACNGILRAMACAYQKVVLNRDCT